MSEKIKVTIEEIEESLCDLDSEYREALATTLMKYKYLSDSPLKLSMGNYIKQEELERVYKRALKPREIKEIINSIKDIMKGDFQYGSFNYTAQYYLNIAQSMEKANKKRER